MIERLSTLVRAAGNELLALRRSASAQGTWLGSQLKTPADDALHRFLSTGLREIAPDIPVISEEDAASHARHRPERYWLIDPIDGTASFSGGFDGFVTQVALMEQSRPSLAAVYAPVPDLLYRAVSGSGATLNGNRLRVRPAPDRKVLIDNYPEPRGIAKAVYLALGCTGYVESGSIALKICRIADGTADIFFKSHTVRDWDVAPGELVLSEAGGCLSDLRGNPFQYVGGFDKNGVVAAHSAALARTAISCHDSVRQEPRSSIS